MIRFEMPDAPDEFPDLVSTPGAEFLADWPNPTREQWSQHDYWNNVKPQLRVVFRKLCAYSAFIVHQEGEVDHYVPKKIAPQRAYDWTNFRFSSGEMNGKKNVRPPNRILDPCQIGDDWFRVIIPGYILEYTEAVPAAERPRAEDTIDFLGLNSETLKDSRRRIGQRLLRNPNNQELWDEADEECPLVVRAIRQYLLEQPNP